MNEKNKFTVQLREEKGIEVAPVQGKNPKIKSLIDDTVLTFEKGESDFESFEEYNEFIKACVKATRQEMRYKHYIGHLKDNGLDHCTFYPKITDDMASIEMHHGPIFTIYDIVSIVVNHLLAEGKKMTTFDVADIVLDQHQLNNIQIVMLCKTAHQEFHDGEIFINLKQSFGKINNFLTTFHKGIREENIYTMQKYIDLSRQHESTDNGILQTFKALNIISEINENKY